MLCGYIVTKLKNTFDSLVCEFTGKAGEGGIVSRCRCNIFTIGNRITNNTFSFRASRIRISPAIPLLETLPAEFEVLSFSMRYSCRNVIAPDHENA